MTTIDLPRLNMIALRYGFPVPDSLPVPWTGATSHVYPVGDVVIKIAFEAHDAMKAVAIDAAMNPVVRELGVSTSELLAFDDARDIVPVPFALYRRVQGAVPLQDVSGPDYLIQQAWQAVGRDLARIHAILQSSAMPIDLRSFRQSPDVDPRPWVDELLERRLLSGPDAAWLHHLLHFLAPFALKDVPLCLCHGDLNGSNVLVSSGSACTLIDWAGAGWLDPVWDFVAVPFAAVSWLLAGHRAVAPLPADDTVEARICWCQTQTRLLRARTHTDRPSTRTELARDLAGIRTFASVQRWEI
jgi:aminoglycoside phosphotransferase (APT) family kinase protein